MPNQYRQRDPRDRFWEKVNRDGPLMPNMESACWQWTGHLKPDGHGSFRTGGVNARRVGPHVFAWELENGPVPAGRMLDHRCRNGGCVRASHLRVIPGAKENGENQSAAAHSNNRSSKYRGVSQRKKDGRWVPTVRHHGKKYYNGSYATEEEAAVAVRELRNRLHTHNEVDR